MKPTSGKWQPQEKTEELISQVQQTLDSYSVALTVRQVYYQLVARQIIPNNLNSYKNLDAVLSKARKNGYLDFDAFTDRIRRPIKNGSWLNLNDFISTVKRSYSKDKWDNQENYVEVWLEKDALAGIFEPITQKYDVNLLVGRGYQSLSSLNDAAARFPNKDIHILYFGDFDNTPRHIFIEEAHEFVPQRVFGAMGKTFNAVSNLVVMGRNRGLGVTLVNQRAATINKDVLTQLDTLLAFRNVSPQDRKALREWVEFHSAEGDFEKFMASLPSLPTGEGWIWSPEFLRIFKRVKIRKRETFHPDREKLGDKFTMPRLDQVDIQSFISKFSESVKQKETKEVKGLGKIQPQQPIQPQEPTRESIELTNLRNEFESKLLQKDVDIRKRDDTLNQIRKIVGSEISGGVGQTVLKSSNLDMWVSKLGNSGAARILKFLAEKSGLKFTRSQVGLAVGLSSKSGSFATYIALLKRNQLIIEQNREVWVNPDL